MELEAFISSAVILLIAASVMVVLFKHLGLGSIAGLLVAGIIVGPYTPGPYITTHVEGLRSFAELGVVLLLFVIGLEIKPSRLWALRREVFGLGSLQIILTASAITGYALLNHWPWKASPGRRDAGAAGGTGEQSSPGCRHPQNGWSAGG